jgi:hypothetical protein
MYTEFIVYPVSHVIIHNGAKTEFDFATPSDLPQDLLMLYWKSGDVGSFYRCESGEQNVPLEESEENYAKWVAPFVSLYEAELEKRRPSLSDRKSEKLSELTAAHEEADENAHLMSSLGYEINAGCRAEQDVQRLVYTIGDGSASFCDYENNFHEVTKKDCETLLDEIRQNVQALYSQKWEIRSKIEAAASNEELDAVKIEFTNLDFSK